VFVLVNFFTRRAESVTIMNHEPVVFPACPGSFRRKAVDSAGASAWSGIGAAAILKGRESFLDEGAGDAIDARIKCCADREFQLSTLLLR